MREFCATAARQQQQLHWWRQTAASVSDSSLFSVHAGSLADQWHARWDVKPRLHILALQQAAPGRRTRKRARPICNRRYAWPVRHGGWPKEARVHHGDVHHLQSLHKGLQSAGSFRVGGALIPLLNVFVVLILNVWGVFCHGAKACVCDRFRLKSKCLDCIFLSFCLWGHKFFH